MSVAGKLLHRVRSAQVGIGALPLVWYGTEEQKKRYLPKLATAEWVGAYALSEASSGSDAMNIRTRATLSADGASYTLNGEKMWITNAGIADLFTVFAKIDGEKFSAFLVERTAPGLKIGAEEHKLGIRGSSTCPLILDNCTIPVANLLGEPGKGHHIAFNVLNMGRFKLGVACVGGARHALGHMVRYAKERKAFGKTIAEFGLIQRKISASATRLYATESMTYRTAGLIEAGLESLGERRHEPREIQRRIEEYAVECSILKVYGSEMMTLVADELVATMGGYGYVEEYPAERFYRDARINRIFEGTNEINRLIITGWLLKRAMRGELPLLGAIKNVMDEVMQPPSFDAGDESNELLAREADALSAMKKVALFAAGAASQRYMAALQDQQEVMADLADMIGQVYALESALLRARKLAAARKGTAEAAAAMTSLLADGESMAMAEQAARRVVACLRRRRHAADATGHSAAPDEVHSSGYGNSEPESGRILSAAGALSILVKASATLEVLAAVVEAAFAGFVIQPLRLDAGRLRATPLPLSYSLPRFKHPLGTPPSQAFRAKVADCTASLVTPSPLK